MGSEHWMSFIEYVGRTGPIIWHLPSCPHLFTEIKIFPEAGILMNIKAKDITCSDGFLASQPRISEELSKRLRIRAGCVRGGRDGLVAAHILHTLFKVNKSCAESCSLSACLWKSVSGLTTIRRQTPGGQPRPISYTTLSFSESAAVTHSPPVIKILYENKILLIGAGGAENCICVSRFTLHLLLACVLPDYCDFSFFPGSAE